LEFCQEHMAGPILHGRRSQKINRGRLVCPAIRLGRCGLDVRSVAGDPRPQEKWLSGYGISWTSLTWLAIPSRMLRRHSSLLPRSRQQVPAHAGTTGRPRGPPSCRGIRTYVRTYVRHQAHADVKVPAAAGTVANNSRCRLLLAHWCRLMLARWCRPLLAHWCSTSTGPCVRMYVRTYVRAQTPVPSSVGKGTSVLTSVHIRTRRASPARTDVRTYTCSGAGLCGRPCRATALPV